MWVDPEVHLWNRSLHDNLRYGSDGPGAPMARVIEAADLRHVLEILPEGFASPLGEGGLLLPAARGSACASAARCTARACASPSSTSPSAASIAGGAASSWRARGASGRASR